MSCFLGALLSNGKRSAGGPWGWEGHLEGLSHGWPRLEEQGERSLPNPVSQSRTVTAHHPGLMSRKVLEH